MKKKIAYGFGGFVLIILGAIILIPFFFKDDIIKVIDDQIAQNVNADVRYNPDDFGLSLFSNFPNMTASMENVAVIGHAPFEGDTLLSLGAFETTIDLMSLFSDQIQIDGIVLNHPHIHVKVLKNGQANYDIAKVSEATPAKEGKNTTESGNGGDLSIGIKHWEIVEGQLTYDDKSLETLLKIEGLNHEGSGDFSLDQFEMASMTTINGLSVAYGGVNYMEKNKLQADITMLMDLANMKFTFQKNEIKLNDFAFGFDGDIAMEKEDILTNLTFASKETTFKSVLSLIPGVFTKDFQELKTKGAFAFNGKVNGAYNAKRIPAFEVNLKVKDGFIQYPDLPSAIEQINFNTSITNSTGIINDTRVNVPNFSMLMGQEKFGASLLVWNLDNIHWDLKAKGGVNLAVIADAVKLEEMSLQGLILADFESKGKLSDVEAKRFDKIHTKGKAEMKEFRFANKDLPQGFDIPYAKLTFNPKEIELKSFQANIDKSDMQANGKLSNYLAFALQKGAVLKGNLDFSSNYFNLNQFMSEDTTAVVKETPKAPEEETTAMGVIEIPKTIDFMLNAKMKEVVVTNLKLEQINGMISIKDGVASLDGLDFNMLGGKIGMDGDYSTKDPTKPSFDYKLKIKDCSVKETYTAFQSVQKLSPIAKNIQGNYSTDFTISGKFLEDMSPDLKSLQGGGEIYIREAAIIDSDIIGKINKLAKIDSKNARLDDTRIKATIQDGKVITQPFDLVVGNAETTMWGSSDFEANLDYNAEVLVPNKKLAKEANKFLSNLLGSDTKLVGDKLQMTFGITGKFDSPKVALKGVKPVNGKSKKKASTAQEEVKKKGKEKVDKEVDKLKKKAEEKLKDQLKKWF